MFCSEHVVQLHRKQHAIRAAGAELHVVGNGAANFIEGFRDKTGFDGPMYVDPSLETYKALGLPRGVMTILKPRAVLDAIRALRRGHRQGLTRGDNWQQGGTVVIAPGNDVLYVHRSQSPGEMPGTAGILAALASR